MNDLKPLLALFDSLKILSPRAPITLALTLFCVATSNGGISPSAIARRVGLTPSAMTAHLDVLGERLYATGKLGLGFVVSEEAPGNRRSKIVKLAPKGSRFIASLVSAMKDNQPQEEEYPW